MIYLIRRDGFRIYRMTHYSHCEEKETLFNPLNTKVIRNIYIYIYIYIYICVCVCVCVCIQFVSHRKNDRFPL